MTRVLLIRHGETDLLGRVLYGRLPGVHLNAAGLRQAETLGAVLNQRYRIDTVASSPLERALETARPIATPKQLAITIDERITEIDFGSWMGKTFAELSTCEHWQRYNRYRSLTSPPGGEPVMAVQARIWCAIADLAGNPAHNERTVALVTHGDVIRSIIMLLLGMNPDNIHRFEIAPASVTEIHVGPHAPIVARMNEVLTTG